jgi:hypothetical protein
LNIFTVLYRQARETFSEMRKSNRSFLTFRTRLVGPLHKHYGGRQEIGPPPTGGASALPL